MTGPVVQLIAASGPWPGSDDPDVDGFRDLVRAAQTIERRRDHGYHLGPDDLRRFSAVSSAIERLARLRGTPIASVDTAVLDSATRTLDRALAGFHPPKTAARWLHGLAALLTDSDADAATTTARRLEAAGQGLVLVPAPHLDGPLWLGRSELGPSTPPPATSAPDVAATFLAATPTWRAFAESADRTDAAQQLWVSTVAALAAGEPIVVGAGARHDVLTEVLNHARAVGDGVAALRLLYVDGSEAEPFPLRRPPATTVDAGRNLRIGLMSMRHTELDLQVDGYWFRNRMVSTTRTLAETDAFCAASTRGRLTDLAAAGFTDLELVHTGFEPAVVGFYRGLSESLVSGATRLRVRPVYLINRKYVEGAWW